MKSIKILLILFVLHNIQFSQEKSIAMTMDDLFYAFNGNSIDSIEKASDELLKIITKENVPVTVFVNEKSFFKEGETDRRLSIVKKWYDNPFVTIGNHTYSHINYAETKLTEFEDDIIQGEAISKALLKKAGKNLKYFRFPYNCTGRDSISKKEIYDFLYRRGYVVTPFTVESADYMYNALYTSYLKKNDNKAANEIIHNYIDFTGRLILYFDILTNQIYDRNISQIYLCHTNLLNSVSFEKLILKLKQNGYSFISLEKALEDSIYRSNDYYTQKFGVSWIYRWIENKDERIKLMRKEPWDKDTEQLYKELGD